MPVARLRRTVPLAAACLLALQGGPAAAANLDKGSVNPYGVMVSPCAGIGFGASFGHAGDYVPFSTPTEATCNGEAAKPAGTALNQSAHSSYPVTFFGDTTQQIADAGAQAGYGWARLASSVQGVGGAGDMAAMAIGGWADVLTLTPSNSAYLGQSAMLSFVVHVDGALKMSNAFNNGPYTEFRMTAYVNDLVLSEANQDYLRRLTYVDGPAVSMVLHEDVLMAIPVTLGEPFRLGVFGRAYSEVWSPLSFPLSTASSEFDHTMTWQGISAVTVDGAPVVYSLSSLAGIDWTQPASPVPEPSPYWLLLAGLAVLGRRLESRALQERRHGHPHLPDPPAHQPAAR